MSNRVPSDHAKESRSGTASNRDGDITQLLLEWQQATAANSGAPDSRAAEARLAEQIYPVLRRLAGRELGSWPSDISLFATEVANEAYLKLVSQTRTNWQNRLHFFAISARLIRRILVDHERKRRALKRGGDHERVQLLEIDEPTAALDIDLLALDQALSSLAETDSRAARVIELRCFGGLTQEEAAEALGVSRSTVVNSFRFGRAWLRKALVDRSSAQFGS